MTTRTIGVAERRARLARRHHLATEAQLPDPGRVASEIVAYHATDPATVYLAAAARTGLVGPEALDRALYQDRSLVRTLGMRRTMFVVPTFQLPVVQAACTDAIAVRERRRTLQLVADAGIPGDPAEWLARVEAETVRVLKARGEATTREVSDEVPELRAQVVVAEGKSYQGTMTLAPRVLFQLAAEGKAVRGRPVKSWVSNYRWALTEAWLTDPPAPVPAAEAAAELARGWLAAFGPGTLADLRWWAGWTAAQARQALAAVGAVEVGLAGDETGYVLPDDLAPVAPPEPWAGLLPGLDPAVMGWAMPGRGWYLDDRHRAALYDRNGNIGPTVWWGGRVVGGWAHRADGAVVFRLLAEVGRDGKAAIRAAARRLQEWLGEVRVTPRFRTPLERELAA